MTHSISLRGRFSVALAVALLVGALGTTGLLAVPGAIPTKTDISYGPFLAPAKLG
jgi:hypothetical protein